jgi:hypothetical protein
MGTEIRTIARANDELRQLQAELCQLEMRVNSLRDSLRKLITEQFGTDCQTLPASQEAALAARVAELVVSRLPIASSTPTTRRQYVREREAAAYMGVSVSALRSWRLRRSKHGPLFTRIGRMVMYSMPELEEHMRGGLVARQERSHCASD